MSQPITLIGAGALGGGLAAHLGAHTPVTLLARPETAARLLAKGLALTDGRRLPTRPGQGTRGSIGVIDSPGSIAPDDAVLFTTKATHLAAAAENVRAGWRRRCGFVAGFQNGLGKDDVLTSVFGTDAVIGALTMTAAARDNRGRVSVTAVGQSYFGELDNSTSDRCHNLAQTLNSSGLPAGDEVPIGTASWMKCCNSVALFATSALCRLDTASLLSTRASLEAFLTLIDEALEVAGGFGIRPVDYPGLPPIASYAHEDRPALLDRLTTKPPSRDTARSYSSMAQDVMAGRSTEVEPIFGDMIRRADQVRVTVPRLRLVRELIRATQR